MAGTFRAFAAVGVRFSKELKVNRKSGSTFLDCYLSANPLGITIQVILFQQLTLVFKFFNLQQDLNSSMNKKDNKIGNSMLFSFTYAIKCLIVQCVEVDLSLIISLFEAAIGYFKNTLLYI